MKTYLALAIAGVALLSASAAGAQSPQQPGSSYPHQRHQSDAQPRAAITAGLKSYEQAPNARGVEGGVKAYTHDAGALPPNAPSPGGSDARRGACTGSLQTTHIELPP